MLVLRQVLTGIFQVSRSWKTGTLKCDEALSSDLILKLFKLYRMFTYVVI